MSLFGKNRTKPEGAPDSMDYLSNIEVNHLQLETKPGEVIKDKAVIELFVTKEPSHDKWIRCLVGVACLIRNRRVKTHYIKIFSVKDKKFIHSEEIYFDFEFCSCNEKFLSFEGRNRMIGLNFHFDYEAQSFRENIMKIAITISKKTKANHGTSQSTPMDNSRKGSTNIGHSIMKKFRFDSLMKSNPQTTKKLQIGGPTDFRHIQLAGSNAIPGYNKNTGFRLEDCNTDWLLLFVTLKLNDKLLSNSNIAKEIVNFVEQHGGIGKVVETIQKKETKESKIQKVNAEQGQKTPLEASRNQAFHSNIEEKEKPTVSRMQSVTAYPSTDEKGEACPKAPPLPPPPPPPPPTPSVSAPKGLPPVPQPPTRDESESNRPPIGGDRNNLLSQIKLGGKVLKSAETSAAKSEEEEEDTIVGVLAKRLQMMNVKMANSDDESEEEEEEWLD